MNPWTESKMVGHADMKMIEQRYGHLYESAAQKEIDRVDEAREAQAPTYR